MSVVLALALWMPLHPILNMRQQNFKARLAQSVERKALNLVVVGSSPTVGVWFSVFTFAPNQYIWFFN